MNWKQIPRTWKVKIGIGVLGYLTLLAGFMTLLVWADPYNETVTPVVAMQSSRLEVCDNIDNNGNGVIDEDFDLRTDSDNCGVCGHRCGERRHCREGFCDWDHEPRLVDYDPSMPSR